MSNERSIERPLEIDNAQQCAMSVDVEEYFQVWAFNDVVAKESWTTRDRRAAKFTRQCLDLFDGHNASATFFVLSWLAEREPQLIREIHDRGHEIASHGVDHTKVFEQSRARFASDVERSKKTLEDITGAAVIGYRAPSFSINENTPWAYGILERAGYQYSSSSHPIAHDHYGDPHGIQVPHFANGSSVLEVPLATTQLAGRRLSCAGGGWFRAAPFGVFDFLLQRALKQNNGPLVFYFHPWELDADQPRIEGATMRARIRHYLNLKSMQTKLEKILMRHSWQRIDRVIEPYLTGEYRQAGAA